VDVEAALHAALRRMDLYRQRLAPSSANKQLLLLSRRLTRIRARFEGSARSLLEKIGLDWLVND